MRLFLLRAFLEIAILATVSLGFAAGGWVLAARLGARPRARTWLALGQVLLAASLALPLAAHVFLRPDALFRAPVMVDSGASRSVALPLVPAGMSASTALVASRAASIGRDAVGALAGLLLAASVLGLARLARDERLLRRACAGATVLRRIGRVRICVSESAAVPFSAWTRGGAYVVLPERFVLEPGHLRIAVAHELSHIRHRDPWRAHVTAALRALLPWHPALRIWSRWFARLEELACDERVLARGSVSPRAYGECLLWAADAPRGSAASPGLAVAMLGPSRTFLERRIAMLFHPQPSRRPFGTIVFAAAALAALAVTAAIGQGVLADRKVDASEAQHLAADLARTRGFSMTADETVVTELNAIVGSAASRARFKEGMERLEAYSKISEDILKKHGVPAEMLAIPQVESRVQALPENANPMRSAGIWQFIPATARHYGLRVGGKDDERLDPVRSAEAAATMLAELHDEFGDWRLAAAAYNAGSDAVRRAIAVQGTKDPVALAKSGEISRYASSVMAAALLIHHPELLD
jgi:peptidoglycan lytic transglycosylase D